MKFSVRLFIAQGFGTGRIRIVPGTFGSMVGIGWTALLVLTGNLWLYVAGAVAAIGISVWLCGAGEKILGQTDPNSIVLDEIIAIPFCFLPWVVSEWLQRGHVMPPVETFCAGRAWLWSGVIFVLFRIFDIWKPWPIRQLQELHGGWGVTVDDLLAAVYVALCTVPFLL